VSRNSPHTLVLGGGPCGLYAARILAQAGARVTVLEKEPVAGGLATSHPRNGNFYDLGCHMLHEFDREIFEDILGIMGEESIPVELNAKIRWAGAFYRYPLQFQDMIRGIPPHKLIWYSCGLLWAQFWQSLRPQVPANAEEALVQLYGTPLYRFFFRDFTHRYWGIHPTGLSATFITTKMPRLSAVDVLKKGLAAIGIKDKTVQAVESALHEETLHYSRTGAEAMPRALVRAILADGGDVRLGAEATSLRIEDGRIAGVGYRQNGRDEYLACDECISTMPVPWLARIANPPPPDDVLEAAARLRYKPIAIHGLLVRKPKCIDALYIYYRDRVFHRVGEPKNAGLLVNPPDHTVLIVETTCEIGDPKWQGTDEIRARILADLEAEGVCNPDQVVESHLLRAETGYPVFDLGFEPSLETVMNWVRSIPNLQSNGRQGAFTYPNMHTAMRMGATCARTALQRIPTR